MTTTRGGITILPADGPDESPVRRDSNRHDSLPDLERTLRQTFGLQRLRPAQRQVIRSVLRRRNVLAIMPTGSGKSLCYQLPTLFMPGTTLVVSPLIALMEDQASKLDAIGVAAEQFNSTLTRREEADALDNVERQRTEFVFVTPERLTNPDFLDTLRSATIDLFVIDEAHCISRWGHDFRPAFLGLKAVVQALGNPPVLALTATATGKVIDDIIDQLGLREVDIVNTGIFRDNLKFSVRPVTNEEDKVTDTVRLVREYAGPGIVYAATIKAVETIHAALAAAGESAGMYHGQLSPDDRKRSQNSFMDGTSRIMVATNAFGMGIDKPDIRFVIHFQIPSSPEAYYQEAGRAGRDGERAECVLLFFSEDKRIQQFFLSRRSSGAADLQTVLAAMRSLQDRDSAIPITDLEAALPEFSANRLQVALNLLIDGRIVVQDDNLEYRMADVKAPLHEIEELVSTCDMRNEQARAAFDQMVFYAQTGYCRWRVLLEYFQEMHDQETCGICDNCLTPPENLLADAATSLHANLESANAPEDDGPQWHEGMPVEVPKHGKGRLEECLGDKLSVRFPDGELRTFLAEFVQAVEVSGYDGQPSEN